MLIGVPKEIKEMEFRVGLTPDGVRILVQEGHSLLIQTKAGEAIGFSDASYVAAGASIVGTAKEVFAADLIVKVKEPQKVEYSLFRPGQLLFCYLHLAPNRELTQGLMDSGIVAIAYETVTDQKGGLPLLEPMSEIAGRFAVQVGAGALQMTTGGKGVLLGGATGVLPARVVIVGGGTAGTEAARVAMGMGADVTILDNNLKQLKKLEHLFGPELKTLYSTSVALAEVIQQADLVIGTVLVPGKMAPKVITRAMVRSMSPGSVLVDVSIDQGGCAETSKPTTHRHPTFVEEGVIHYCVTNMTGACARTSTQALTNATLTYVRALAKKGYLVALQQDAGLRAGLSICKGYITNGAVATDLGLPYHPAEQLL